MTTDREALRELRDRLFKESDDEADQAWFRALFDRAQANEGEEEA